jgi:hypothetical protein
MTTVDDSDAVLAQSIAEWNTVSDELKEINTQISGLRKTKRKLEKIFVQYITTHELDEIILGHGRLFSKIDKDVVGYNQKAVEAFLGADDIQRYVDQNQSRRTQFKTCDAPVPSSGGTPLSPTAGSPRASKRQRPEGHL